MVIKVGGPVSHPLNLKKIAVEIPVAPGTRRVGWMPTTGGVLYRDILGLTYLREELVLGTIYCQGLG